MQHGPRTDLVAPLDCFGQDGCAFQRLQKFSISRGPKSRRTYKDFARTKIFSDKFCAAHVLQITMSQDQVAEAIDSLSTQKWFRDKPSGRFIAAIDQPIIAKSRLVQKDGLTSVERQDRRAYEGTIVPPLTQPEQCQD